MQHLNKKWKKIESAKALKRMTIMVVLFAFLSPNVTFSMDNETAEKALSQIEQSLDVFDRDSAYTDMKTLKASVTFDQMPSIYLENLSLMVKQIGRAHV